MASATDSDSKTANEPLRNMSIARLIPRFTKPRLLTTDIPTYRHSFSPPSRADESHGEASASAEKPEPAAIQQPSGGPAYVEWSKLLPTPSNLLGSFSGLFSPRLPILSASPEPQNPQPASRPPPRLIFFGEQHHQPQVMRAQLQTLHALHSQCRLASSSATEKQPPSPIYRLHLVLEQFSILDQDMLHSFSRGELNPDQLAEAYHAQSEEAFSIGHYMPLLMLAKELEVPVWGGFPPRSWARSVFRDGIEGVKVDEERRVRSASEEVKGQVVGSARELVRSPLFTSWSAVTKIGAAHRSYLSGLMRPDLPPRFPQLPGAQEVEAVRSTIYPTWLLNPHKIETKGFGPAQALKDSYLAHVTAWILRGARPAENVLHSLPASSREAAVQAERPVVNIALVVCGLGHCEYGFGAPERVVQLLAEGEKKEEDVDVVMPFIIASKPVDSGIWLGYEHALQPAAVGKTIVEGVSAGSIGEEATKVRSSSETAETAKRWLEDPWGRKMADAVLLYDWIDDEPADEGEAKANSSGEPSANPDAQIGSNAKADN